MRCQNTRMIELPWCDPVSDSPEEYEEILVTTATGRVTSCHYYKGKFSTIPVMGDIALTDLCNGYIL